jgi:PIN domain nuclease of toxin-antitoxin system
MTFPEHDETDFCFVLPVPVTLRNPANELCHSPVSTWEALLLNAKGRIRLPAPANLSEWLTAATAPLREAPLTHEIVLIAQELPLPQRDPADRESLPRR